MSAESSDRGKNAVTKPAEKTKRYAREIDCGEPEQSDHAERREGENRRKSDAAGHPPPR